MIIDHIRELASLISTEKLNHFYIPKFFDLCLDDVFEVRETAAKKVTAAVLKNVTKSGRQDVLNNVLDQMKFFKDSEVYSHRVIFIGMI